MLIATFIDGISRMIGEIGAPCVFNNVSFSTWILLWQFGSKRGEIYNILWALVFGFATLNILSLVTRRYEPNRSRMSPGEVMAVMTVVVSVLLLSFEMLGVFHVLPLRVHPH